MSVHLSHLGPIGELHRYWLGKGPLGTLFWVYGVLFSTLGGTVLTTAVTQGLLPLSALLGLILLGLLYTGFILISIWRCAFNISSTPLGIERETWAWLARILTFGWALNAGGASLMLLQYALKY